MFTDFTQKGDQRIFSVAISIYQNLDLVKEYLFSGNRRYFKFITVYKTLNVLRKTWFSTFPSLLKFPKHIYSKKFVSMLFRLEESEKLIKTAKELFSIIKSLTIWQLQKSRNLAAKHEISQLIHLKKQHWKLKKLLRHLKDNLRHLGFCFLIKFSNFHLSSFSSSTAFWNRYALERLSFRILRDKIAFSIASSTSLWRWYVYIVDLFINFWYHYVIVK